MCVRAGTGPADLQDVRVVTLEKPDGWITFDISSESNDDGDGLLGPSLSFSQDSADRLTPANQFRRIFYKS